MTIHEFCRTPSSTASRKGLIPLSCCLLLLAVAPFANAFNYVQGVPLPPNTIIHPGAYDGTGGYLAITVGYRPGMMHANDVVVPLQNAISRWNSLSARQGNLIRSGLGEGQVDFESALLHEIGHALGLAHPNVATLSSTNNYCLASIRTAFWRQLETAGSGSRFRVC